jgi:DNA polymerase-3 subunit beta
LLSGVEQLLTIGEFAQRCGLSRSALRFYAQNGLLQPRIVDEQTGYRYYAMSQLSEALLVSRLRAAEMPVAMLREYLACTAPAQKEILDRHSNSFQERARAVNDMVLELRDDLDRASRAGDQWCALTPGEFAAALDQVSFAVGDPTQRVELGVIWLETREMSLRLVATDSFRLAVRDLVPDDVGPSAIRGAIDAGALQDLIAGLRGARSLVLSQNSDGFLNASVDYQSLEIGGAGEGFPDYERILAELPLGDQAVVERSELEGALARLPSGTAEVALRLDSDGLALESNGVVVSAGGTWPGSELTIWLDRNFMTEAVHATVGPDVTIEAADALQPVTLRSADTGTFSVLTMPIRPPNPV